MAKKKPIIYLDNAATTRPDSKVKKAMRPYLEENYGNASSIHQLGQASRAAVDKAREQTAQFLNCKPSEVIFTGSATESDNLAILGAVKAAQKRGVKLPHIITTKIEHPAVLETVRHLEKTGDIEATYLPVSKDGLVQIEAVEKALKPNTCLVSVMYANNEIGTIQPIAKIANLIRNLKLQTTSYKLPINLFFHTDAVQAANYLDCDVQKLGVDLLTLSGHKIYGPKGIGVLYIRQGAGLEPVFFGGHQEYGMRPGTENVPAIVGMGAAVAGIKNQNSKIKNTKQKSKILILRDRLIDGVLQQVPGSRLNGSPENRLPNNANFSFEGCEGEAIIIALDQEGICASTGSACSSGSLEPSHVLLALGLNQKQAHGSLRLTLGRHTTAKDINDVIKILPQIIQHLREVSGYNIKS